MVCYHMAFVLPIILVTNSFHGVHVGGRTLLQSDIVNKTEDEVQLLGTSSSPSKLTSVRQQVSTSANNLS